MTMLQDAISELGVVEGKGSLNDPRVIEYHSVTGAFSKDSVPWCGSFMAWLAKKNGIPFTSYKAAAALYWATDWITEGYGKRLKKPIPGAIMVKQRTGGNHVTIFHRWIDKKQGIFEGIGGNQSGGKKTGHDGAVTLARFQIADFFSIAWPAKVPIPSAYVPPAKSGVVQTATAVGGTGVVTAVAIAPELGDAIQTVTNPSTIDTVATVVKENGGSLVEAVHQQAEAKASGTIFGAVVAVVIIVAAVAIIVTRINNARKDRAATEA